MKRLLYIQDSFGNGGINVVESIKENYLFDKGYDVCNLNVLNDNKFDGSYLYRDGIIKYYINNEYLKKLYRVPIIGVFLRFFYFRIKLIYLILKIDPDIIIASRDELEPFTVVLCTFWKKRILEFHCTMMNLERNDFSVKDKLRTSIKYRFYNIVSLTTRDQKVRHEVLNQNVFCIPNPLSQDIVKCSEQDQNKILILARFSREKNIPNLLKAWSVVQQKHPDWLLDIFGDGEEKETIQKIIANNCLYSVHLHGYTKEPLKIIPNYSFALLPSSFEGFPMILLECMGCGVPVVAYDCMWGPSEVITDSVDGILVPLNDMDAFIDRVNYLIENPEIRKSMSMKCRESIKRFNLDSVMKQWINLFEII